MKKEVSILQHSKDISPRTVPFDEVVEMIKGDAWPPNYEPVMLVKGVYKGNVRQKDITSLSGLSVAVFRHVDSSRLSELREDARNDPHTLLLYTVADDLIIIYPFELDIGYEIYLQCQFYQKAFLYGNDYYERLLDAQSVHVGKDAGKCCPLAHDEEAFYNPQADPFFVWEIKEGCRRMTSKQKSREGLHDRKPNYKELMMSLDEIEDWLKHNIELRRNVITSRLEYRWLFNNAVCGTGPWENFDETQFNTVWRRLEKIKTTKEDYLRRTIESDYVKDFNPFRSYLDSLPPWDGNDHILYLGMGVSVEGDQDDRFFFVECLRKWLVAMVAGWLEPDEVNHVVLVFIGPQGINKTTWMNHLLPPELRNYFCTQMGIGSTDKDTLLAMAQYGLICCEELDSMNNREMNGMKRAVTLSHIDARPAYQRYTVHKPHIASFCGTGNNEKFLNDPTGTRRWLAFKVNYVDSPRTFPFEYEKIYAQAYYLYRNGFKYWFSDSESSLIDKRNNSFKVANLEKQLVYRFYRHPSGANGGEFVDVGTAMQMFPGNVSSKISKEAVDQAFIDLGFETIVCDGMPGYLATRRMPEEINVLGRQMALQIKPTTNDDEPF